MALTAQILEQDLQALGAIEPRIARALEVAGLPNERGGKPGYATLLRTIVGQQVSAKAAAAVWAKLEAGLGALDNPHVILEQDYDTLRSYGLSRQKQGYARSLAELVVSGALTLEALPQDDEDAIAMLTQVKGIGRWSAEIYLIFAEGRRDIWPAGDLAVQISTGRIMGLEERPSEKALRAVAEPWSPYRSAAALFAWHCYRIEVI